MWSGRCWRALGPGKLELRGGEVIDNERRLPPELQYYTETPLLPASLHKRKRKNLDPFSTIQPLLKKNVAFFSSSLSTLFFFPPAPLQVDQLMCNELFESLQVLSVQLHVIVPGPLHPERLHGALTAFIQSQAMGEVDDLVLRTVDHQYR